MFVNNTYWFSGVPIETKLMIDVPIFLLKFLINSSPSRKSKYLTITFTAANTTDGLIWESLGKTLSVTISASYDVLGSYVAKKSRINTCPHSKHSLTAIRSLLNILESTSINWRFIWVPISTNDETVLARTKEFGYLAINCCRV